MFKQLLQLVAEGGIHSYIALAGQLGVSTGLLEQMLQDLARMGYIVSISGTCNASQCHHCPLSGSCTPDKQDNIWMLTSKGMQAAARREEGKNMYLYQK